MIDANAGEQYLDNRCTRTGLTTRSVEAASHRVEAPVGWCRYPVAGVKPRDD